MMLFLIGSGRVIASAMAQKQVPYDVRTACASLMQPTVLFCPAEVPLAITMA